MPVLRARLVPQSNESASSLSRGTHGAGSIGTKEDIEVKNHPKAITRLLLRDSFRARDQLQRRNELTATFRVILIIVKFVLWDNILVPRLKLCFAVRGTSLFAVFQVSLKHARASDRPRLGRSRSRYKRQAQVCLVSIETETGRTLARALWRDTPCRIAIPVTSQGPSLF